MSDRQKQLELIAAFLREQSTLALATVDAQGEADIAPLFYLADEDLSLFWLSSGSSVHSENLKRTPRAAATVYRQTNDWKQICGVQMRGTVARIAEPTQRKAKIQRYCERFQLGLIFRVAIRQSILYAFRPDFFRYIDNSKHFGYQFEVFGDR
jgi:hypothetical protein